MCIGTSTVGNRLADWSVNNGGTTSALLRCSLAKSIFLCSQGVAEGCSMLANLCVFTYFDANQVACNQFKEIMASKANVGDGYE